MEFSTQWILIGRVTVTVTLFLHTLIFRFSFSTGYCDGLLNISFSFPLLLFAVAMDWGQGCLFLALAVERIIASIYHRTYERNRSRRLAYVLILLCMLFTILSSLAVAAPGVAWWKPTMAFSIVHKNNDRVVMVRATPPEITQSQFPDNRFHSYSRRDSGHCHIPCGPTHQQASLPQALQVQSGLELSDDGEPKSHNSHATHLLRPFHHFRLDQLFCGRLSSCELAPFTICYTRRAGYPVSFLIEYITFGVCNVLEYY